MKRSVLILAVSAFFAVAASAQIQSGFGGMQTNGIPASVTSPRPGNSAPGIAPSVTSLHQFPTRQSQVFIGTNGFNHNGFDRDHDVDRDNRFHHRRRNFNNGYAYVYPGYLYDNTDYADQQDQYPPQNMQAAEPEAPAQTVFENRPGYKPAPPQVTNEAAADANAVAAQAQQPEPEPAEPTTLLVFKDGHHEEIGNYVIVGDTLYNMAGGYRSYKIPLAQLDLAATVKANEDRGIEFHLPKKSA